jgi:hypothetical protein
VGHTRDKTCQCIVDTQTHRAWRMRAITVLNKGYTGDETFQWIQHTHRTPRMGADIKQRTRKNDRLTL